MSGPQLHRQIPPQVNHRRLGSAVPVRALLANGPDAQAGNRRSDDHAARLVHAGILLQKGRKLPDGVKHSPDVQVHDLGESRIRVLVKGGAPCRSSVSEKNVDVVSVFGDFSNQMLYARDGGGVGGDRDGLGAGGETGEGVEGLDGGVAGGSFAGGDEDFGGAGLEEAVGYLSVKFKVRL